MQKQGNGFSIVDLQSGAKKLQSTGISSNMNHKVENDTKAFVEENNTSLKQLEEVYLRNQGDIINIFNELNANPSKALKPHHKPLNEKEFALKYLQGFYSVIDDIDDIAESKNNRK